MAECDVYGNEHNVSRIMRKLRHCGSFRLSNKSLLQRLSEWVVNLSLNLQVAQFQAAHSPAVCVTSVQYFGYMINQTARQLSLLSSAHLLWRHSFSLEWWYRICYIFCVCGCGCMWVCERPWRDPSGLSVGVAYVYRNQVVKNSKFRVKSRVHLWTK